MFIIGRIVCGLSCGLGSLVVPTYIGEVSTIKGRGTFGSCNQLGVVIGILVSSGIGMPLANVPLWRVNYAIPAFPAILQAFLMPSCVESPRWLVSQSRIADARNSLQRLRGDAKIDQEFFEIVEGQYGTSAATDILRNGEFGDEGVKIPTKDEADMNNTDANFEEKGENDQGVRAAYSMLDVLRDPVTRRIGFTVFVHHIIQQLSGMNAVMYYSTTIFNLAFDEQMAQSMTIVDTAVNLIATLVAIAIIDKLGRRPLMLIAEAGTCIFSVLLVIGYKTNTPGLLVASVFLYVASFAVGIGPIPWLITSEMTPTYAASAVGAASTCINWCMNFLIGQIFPVIFAAIQGWSFLIFAGICALAFCFTFFFLPETRGRSLESIVKSYEKYRN
jgi:MFS family permease